jgi:hypothetical protein
VSFFDDEPDQPTRVNPRPARPRRASSARGSRAPEGDLVARRRLVLFAGLAVIAVVMILLIRSCASNSHKNALKDYNRNVASIVADSDDKVSKQLFDILSRGGQSQDVQVAVQQVRLQAEEDAARAKKLSPPGDAEAEAAQHDFELVMNLRAAAVRKIAEQLPRAMSNQGGNIQAIDKIAGQTQAFLASDVVYSQRVAPLIQEALDKNGIHGQTIAKSQFLPSIGWLDPGQVGDRINPNAGVSQGAKAGQPKPGTHGHGLVSVKANGTVLQPGGAVNRVTATAPLPIDVTFANQGQNNETNVKVVARLTGGPKTLTAQRTLNQTTAGSQATVTLQLTQVPPKGTSTTLTVTVEPVPGEKKTDNNTQRYIVLFT